MITGHDGIFLQQLRVQATSTIVWCLCFCKGGNYSERVQPKRELRTVSVHEYDLYPDVCGRLTCKFSVQICNQIFVIAVMRALTVLKT
jgi:hypothetical protein